MRNCARILIIVLLAVTYCFSTNILFRYKKLTEKDITYNQTQNDLFVKAVNELEYALCTGKEYAAAKLIPDNFVKINSEHFFGLCRLKTIGQITTASRYLIYAEYFLSSLKKPDIIFPFHYFW